MYYLFATKKRDFYIPSWLKYSLRMFFPILMIFSFLGIIVELEVEENNKSKDLKVNNEEISLIQYRYIKELSSKNIFN